ncbi:hypothetical protein AK830_g10013 [Neonectria ditissima]|uniref:Zn(2)-C6 fungal-type domain-containing protein n=1 Tax=Neonectria ditissima TaxID=78410 RepID=A0A0P7B4E4_9HYPO|nr:hypothetical protein AK830_g10013 [Neonectria ditissima]
MPRLYHTKSKTGCKRCRARRVKCDESRPTCGSCRRHKVQCTYDRADSTDNPSQLHDESKNRTHSPSMAEGRERRHRELRLMHTFTVRTCRTLPGTHLPELLETWAVEVPRLALDYEPLLSAIMALTSHHLAREARTRDEADGFLTLRSLYLESTLHKHRRALADVTRDKADAVCFTTVILTIDTMANLGERSLQPYEPPLQWLHVSRGVGDVCRLTLGLIEDDADAKIRPVVDTMMPFVRDFQLASGVDPALAYLLEFEDGEAEADEDTGAYEATARLLSWILAGRDSGEDVKMYGRRLTAFPVLVSGRFISLLEQQRPRALVFLAHFFGLAAHASEFWWLGATPCREIWAIRAVLGPEWQGLVAGLTEAAPGKAEPGQQQQMDVDRE